MLFSLSLYDRYDRGVTFTTDEQKALPERLRTVLETSVAAVDPILVQCFSVTLQLVGASTPCLLTGQANPRFFDTAAKFKIFLDRADDDAKSRCLVFLAPYHAFGNAGFKKRTRSQWKHKLFGYWLKHLQQSEMKNHSNALALFGCVQKRLFGNLQANLQTLHKAVRAGRDQEDDKSTGLRTRTLPRDLHSQEAVQAGRGEEDHKSTGLRRRRSGRLRTPTDPKENDQV